MKIVLKFDIVFQDLKGTTGSYVVRSLRSFRFASPGCESAVCEQIKFSFLVTVEQE
jgi:hypothetical protein